MRRVLEFFLIGAMVFGSALGLKKRMESWCWTFIPSMSPLT